MQNYSNDGYELLTYSLTAVYSTMAVDSSLPLPTTSAIAKSVQSYVNQFPAKLAITIPRTEGLGC